MFEDVYGHECRVSAIIDELINEASEEKDMASQDFLWGYIREQVEQATAKSIVEMIRICGKEGLLLLDDKMGQRQ